MKKTFSILAVIAVIAVIVVCCINIPTGDQGPLGPDMGEKIANVIGTKVENPLDQTIWEYNTGEEFNQYLYFTGGEVRFFYGKYVNEPGLGLLRYTDFYSSMYVLDPETGKVTTDIEYPNYGDVEKVNIMDVLVFDNLCQISSLGKIFNLTTYDPGDIQEQWVEVIVQIAPWN